MEAADYTELLRQAEEELGKTPGAYCSRKVAIRAMEILRELGQKQVDEQTAKDRAAYLETCEKQSETIKRQAEAIKRLESEKTNALRNKPAEESISRIGELLKKERERAAMPGAYERAIQEQEIERRRRMEAEKARYFRNGRDPLSLDKMGPPFQDFPPFR